MGTKNSGSRPAKLAGNHPGYSRTHSAASKNGRTGFRTGALGRHCTGFDSFRPQPLREGYARTARWLGLGAALLLLCPNIGFAKPQLKEHLGPETVLPKTDSLKSWIQEIDDAKGQEGASPEDIVRDPKKMVAFLKGRPDRMDVSRMDPALALTVSGVLIEGGAWLTAEKMLFNAVKLWPDRADLRTTHGRVLIQLGRPGAALRTTTQATKTMPELSAPHFLRALALLRVQPITKARRLEAMGELEKVLALDPDFRDPSGWTATDVRNQLRQMRAGRREAP